MRSRSLKKRRTALPGPASGRRISAGLLWGAALTLVIGLTYAVMGVLYARECRSLSGAENVWFGTDIIRHIGWVTGSASRTGVRLHPLGFGLFRLYGSFYRLLGAPGEGRLLVYALPVLLATAWTVSWAARRAMAGRGRAASTVAVVPLLLFGPTLIFAPVPESHLLGGCALLLEAVFLRELMVALGAGDSAAVRSLGRRAALAAAAAIGFSISNVLPASLLLLCLPGAWRRRAVRIAVPVAVGTVLFWLGGASLRPEVSFHGGVVAWFRSAAAAELHFLHVPTPLSFARSFSQLVLLQFGVPEVRLVHLDFLYQGLPVYRLYPADSFPWLQAGAGGLLVAALVQYWHDAGRRAPDERRMLLGCALALGGLVAFHSAYATREVFIFVPHAWPFLALPATWALAHALRYRRVGMLGCLGGAAVLTAMQLPRGISSLLSTLPRM